jgi:hypothetical protein
MAVKIGGRDVVKKPSRYTEVRAAAVRTRTARDRGERESLRGPRRLSRRRRPDVLALRTQVAPWMLVGEHGLRRTALRALDVEHGRPMKNSHAGSLVRTSRKAMSKREHHTETPARSVRGRRCECATCRDVVPYWTAWRARVSVH